MNKSLYYFFAKAYELLNRNTFDSYRVNLHNPYTIFVELGVSIEKFNKKKIKRFDPTITSIGEEARHFIKNEFIEPVFSFGEFSPKQVDKILESSCIKNKDGKNNRTLTLLSKSIEIANTKFMEKLVLNIQKTVDQNDDNDFLQLDFYTNWLLSQLIYLGHSRKFIKDRLHKCEKSIKEGNSIQDCFSKLILVFSKEKDKYNVLFKIKIAPETEFLPASSSIREIADFPNEYLNSKHINKRFKEKGTGELFFVVETDNLDFWSALRKAYQLISETIEINILNNSDNRIILEHQALIIHCSSKHYRMEAIEEKLDGFYTYNDGDFKHFIENYRKLAEGSTAKEKIRSAIRFYKLGNESIEIEHKILNYWIGFEQLFSAVDSEEDSIKRIKAFFISMNASLYFQSRVQYLLRCVERCGETVNLLDLSSSISLPEKHILITNRWDFYKAWLSDSKQIKSAIETHIKRLDQHITRIYRLRNELVHEGRSESVSLFLIAGHLRHYLLFSIEQITNELQENAALSHLDDVFVYYENLLDRIKNAVDISEIISIKPYKGFME